MTPAYDPIAHHPDLQALRGLTAVPDIAEAFRRYGSLYAVQSYHSRPLGYVRCKADAVTDTTIQVGEASVDISTLTPRHGDPQCVFITEAAAEAFFVAACLAYDRDPEWQAKQKALEADADEYCRSVSKALGYEHVLE